MQDRRFGFDSTTSSIGDIGPSSISERSTFERRRRTNGSISLNRGLLDNTATDQKIPSIIRPIPDEMEEINLKGSLSMSATDREDDRKGSLTTRTGDRILVQHSGEKTNLKDRIQKSLEADLKPAERDLAFKLQGQIKRRKDSRMRP